MRNNRRPRCGCPRPNCGCQSPIIHPVKENVVHCCTEETVKHIHPSHTTVMNHHLVKNEHVFPHSTSVQNTFSEVNVNAGGRPPFGGGPGNQVGGAMNPGGPGQQVGGAHHHHQQGMGCGCPPHGMHHCGKPNHWR